MNEICFKCKKSFDRYLLYEIHPSLHTSCYLCPKCSDAWTVLYNKWKKTGRDDFWNKGWEEFQKGTSKFNPSIRGSK